MATVLDQQPIIGRVQKDVRVEITADTIITREGRGVPVYKGSVLDVTEMDAAMLIGSVKARKSSAEVKIVPNPYLNSPKPKAN